MKKLLAIAGLALMAPLSAIAQSYSAETEVILHVSNYCSIDAVDLVQLDWSGGVTEMNATNRHINTTCSLGVPYEITAANTTDGSILLRDGLMNRDLTAKLYQYEFGTKGNSITNADGFTGVGTGYLKQHYFMLAINEGGGKRPAVGNYDGQINWELVF
ncbi:hypothetical protein [Pseudoxanthomonas winnipegensis]|uniref:hypothetical protein n=1 Tax=Pseudoxanthomonas winnipegensis TaxID=2480810 RepID=UPI00103DF6F8|nr:hypothetical protein [Pseudoxanthomonas winnipegensis]TBV69173.1 hypothetical protein EYC45_19840 [Pseudoxanthomonas winnipegensis]